MYRYQPPKSNIWGHRLQKLSAERERELFQRFLATAVAEYICNGSLNLTEQPSETVKRFENLLNKTALYGSISSLTAQECEQSLDEIMGDDALMAKGKTRVRFGLVFHISKWRIDGHEAPTESMLCLQYGPYPCVSTFLRFDTVEQFQYIQRVLEELRFCKLNEKHLKLDKVRMAKIAREAKQRNTRSKSP